MTGTRWPRWTPTLILPLFRSDEADAVPDALPLDWGALMPFTVDARFFSNTKIMATALDERGMFVTVGTWTRDNAPDGVVPRHVLTGLGCTPDLENRLVAHGLWRRAKRGRIAFEDWDFWNAPAASPDACPPAVPAAVAPPVAPRPPVARAQSAGARKQRLSRSGIKHAVRERDRDQCRYCGMKVQWGIGRASDSATYDFTDPDGPVEESNVVVSCAACHSRKGDKTMEQAGMKLLPVPPCTPSELGERACTPYRTPSRGTRTPSRKGYTEETAGQKGYTGRTPSALSDDLDFDLSMSAAQQLRQPSKSKSSRSKSRARGSEPKRGTPEFRLAVRRKFAAVVKVEIDDATADFITADVLGDRNPDHPLLYVERSIEKEIAPLARWLSSQPQYSGELVRRPHCGDRWCDPDTRRREDPETRDDAGPCPKCSGLVAAWEVA